MKGCYRQMYKDIHTISFLPYLHGLIHKFAMIVVEFLVDNK